MRLALVTQTDFSTNIFSVSTEGKTLVYWNFIFNVH